VLLLATEGRLCGNSADVRCESRLSKEGRVSTECVLWPLLLNGREKLNARCPGSFCEGANAPVDENSDAIDGDLR